MKDKICIGRPDNLFEGKLQWTDRGSGYININGGLPKNSVEFWIPDKNLCREIYENRVRYHYPIIWRSIKFIGFQDPIKTIHF